jgi:hypothetical protein
MIDALDYTIEQLLRSELDVDGAGIEVSFNQPNGQWAGRRSGPALNFFLYDVRDNPTLRHHQWQQEPEHRSRPARDGGVTFKRTPLMLDCFYMVTAWSGADEAVRPFEEHNLLSRVLRALARYPILNPPYELVKVERRARGQMTSEPDILRRAWLGDPALNPLAAVEVEIRARIAHHDVLTNPADVWSALEAQMKAGFSYVVTLPLDPWAPFESQRVKEHQLQIGPTARDPKTGELRRIDPDAADRLYTIGGIIRDIDNVRQGGLQLHLLHGRSNEHTDPRKPGKSGDNGPHRYITKTSADGEYRYSDLTQGMYTLLIYRSPDEIVVREFTLSPAGPTGFDFTI